MNDAEFSQSGPALENTWEHDPFLQSGLRRLLPEDTFAEILPGLASLGERAAFEMPIYAADAERNPPEHFPYDPWGRRVDEIRVAEGWRQLHRVAAEEGVVATAYERHEGEYSRLHQFARLYLYHPSSAICSCPLAMTDGAARVVELHGTDAMRARALPRLTSRDPEKFWTSGQWMTERAGGSDVSRTETVARQNGEIFRLHGAKWFTSATTSQMAFTLARIETERDASSQLSLFYLELRDHDGRLNGIRINRLKDKLGTRALPTAELTLEGTPATLVGESGKGVRTISTLLNITRLYNACSAASQMRRAVTLARDYAHKRKAFGKPLIEHALHERTLAEMETETRGATLMVLHAAALLGRDETNVASETERKLLRLLTPVIKLYTAKQCVAVCSEALESFGGAGYVEDTGLPALLRDAQVLSIWEGTTNVLSLDLLRAAGKDDSIPLWLDDVNARLRQLRECELSSAISVIQTRIHAFMEKLQGGDPESNARRLAYAMARIHGAVLLAEQAAWETGQATVQTRLSLDSWLSREIVTA
ncbi:MAG: acyl-CoA dehydrogenase family protein [Proteobacteria bacterium]|nr:acyl-CoA dehydrogenase family protein [Pseudomonadota bacterium]